MEHGKNEIDRDFWAQLVTNLIAIFLQGYAAPKPIAICQKLYELVIYDTVKIQIGVL